MEYWNCELMSSQGKADITWDLIGRLGSDYFQWTGRGRTEKQDMKGKRGGIESEWGQGEEDRIWLGGGREGERDGIGVGGYTPCQAAKDLSPVPCQTFMKNKKEKKNAFSPIVLLLYFLFLYICQCTAM